MAVHNTADEGVAALFDGTTGIAFGPIFNSGSEAEDFLAWLKGQHGIEDARTIPPQRLRDLGVEWDAERDE